MVEISALEVAVLTLSAAGIAAGVWFFLSARTFQAAVALGIAVLLPVLGPILTLVAAALYRVRLRRRQSVSHVRTTVPLDDAPAR